MKNEYIGIIMGFVFGGIIGAIFGGFVGRNFDKAKAEGWSKRRKITLSIELGILIFIGVVPWLTVLSRIS